MFTRQVTRSLARFNKQSIRMYSGEGAGATGGPRSAQDGPDAFQQREAASENYYIKQHEAEQLKAWKALHQAKKEGKSADEQAQLQKDLDEKDAKLENAKKN